MNNASVNILLRDLIVDINLVFSWVKTFKPRRTLMGQRVKTFISTTTLESCHFSKIIVLFFTFPPVLYVGSSCTTSSLILDVACLLVISTVFIDSGFCCPFLKSVKFCFRVQIHFWLTTLKLWKLSIVLPFIRISLWIAQGQASLL